MTEHDIQNSIRLKLSELGYAVFRINSGKVRMADGRWFDTGVPKGFSDLIACKGGKIYFLEVKNETGTASPEQLNFLEVMRDKYGCAGGIVRSVEDAVRIVERN
ncbi:VRR-NUC domain-containing protein [Ruminococcus sp.]|uniref:VRR-NUC domain-containing protein n=1 Tax=Ruminococcus sp. TaxID=41978 RepID=UPI001B556FAE|nr:VRR-NUC domain-containing protein [Ruminococcus sp.]MBP5431017.1 VRR-NUC domain-containing protein [Ruminococcus sp.]